MKEKLSVAVYRETNIFYDKTTLTQYFSTTQLYRGHYKVNSNTKKVIIPRKTQENNHHTVKPKEERHTYTHTHTHTLSTTTTNKITGTNNHWSLISSNINGQHVMRHKFLAIPSPKTSAFFLLQQESPGRIPLSWGLLFKWFVLVRALLM